MIKVCVNLVDLMWMLLKCVHNEKLFNNIKWYSKLYFFNYNLKKSDECYWYN
jgi:hypothetical protein